MMLTWTESGGPEVSEPVSGRGSSIVNLLLSGIGSNVHREWRREGLVAKIEMEIGEDPA